MTIPARYHPDDEAAVLAANAPRLLAIAKAVQAAIKSGAVK